MPVRTTVYLDEQVLDRLHRILPPRQLNRFVNEAVAEKVEALERLELERAMKEGYLAVDRERAGVGEEWCAVDREGWPE